MRYQIEEEESHDFRPQINEISAWLADQKYQKVSECNDNKNIKNVYSRLSQKNKGDVDDTEDYAFRPNVHRDIS